MKIGVLFIMIVALHGRVKARERTTCHAQAMCELPSKNDTKLTHVKVYPYSECGEGSDLISIVNESYKEFTLDLIEDLTEQLMKKKCLSDEKPESKGNQHIKRDKCFSPVICNQKKQAQARWIQTQPFPNCNGTSMKDLQNLFNESKEIAIKKIEKLLEKVQRCPLKAISTIDRLRKQNWTLTEEDAEDCFMPVYCQYETGVGENWLRFYPPDCKSLVSIPQAENAFTTALKQAKKDFAANLNDECDTSCESSFQTTFMPTSTADASLDNINECSADHTCHVYAECTNTTGSFKCTCKYGFRGNGTNCSEIDECTDTELTHNCHVNADCVNTLGSFNCSCRIGFTGTGTFCSDINECKVTSHNCDTHADCTNTAGSFNCTCRDGFAGNGTICQDITCKDGWHKASDGHCYKLFKSRRNFDGARESCKNELNGSATLAIGVRNLTIRSEIVGALELASSLIPRVIWIGLAQQKSNGSWQWDDGTPMTRTQGLNGWRSGEPSNALNEDCAGMDRNHGFGFGDFACASDAFYLCESEHS